MANRLLIVIVRRVVEARRLHYGHSASDTKRWNPLGLSANGTIKGDKKRRRNGANEEEESVSALPSSPDLQDAEAPTWGKRVLGRSKTVTAKEQGTNGGEMEKRGEARPNPNGSFLVDYVNPIRLRINARLRSIWRRLRCS